MNLLIGSRRKNGNQHKINIPTTIPKVLAKTKKDNNFHLFLFGNFTSFSFTF
jgi:hypothetical protein